MSRATLFHFETSNSTRKTRWDRFLVNPGSIRSRSVSLPHSRAPAGSIRSWSLSLPRLRTSAGSTRTQALSEALAGSIRSPYKRTQEEAFYLFEHHDAGILSRQPLLVSTDPHRTASYVAWRSKQGYFKGQVRSAARTYSPWQSGYGIDRGATSCYTKTNR